MIFCALPIPHTLQATPSATPVAFKWFEATPSGGEGMQRDAVVWSDVDGAESVGQWNGCASPLHAPRGRCVLTLAAGCMAQRCGTRALRRT